MCRFRRWKTPSAVCVNWTHGRGGGLRKALAFWEPTQPPEGEGPASSVPGSPGAACVRLRDKIRKQVNQRKTEELRPTWGTTVGVASDRAAGRRWPSLT